MIEPLPYFAISNLSDCFSGYRELRGYLSMCHPGFEKSPDLTHIIVSQLRHTLAFAAITAALGHFIEVVVHLGATEQAFWIHARRIVAVMQDVQWCRIYVFA